MPRGVTSPLGVSQTPQQGQQDIRSLGQTRSVLFPREWKPFLPELGAHSHFCPPLYLSHHYLSPKPQKHLSLRLLTSTFLLQFVLQEELAVLNRNSEAPVALLRPFGGSTLPLRGHPTSLFHCRLSPYVPTPRPADHPVRKPNWLPSTLPLLSATSTFFSSLEKNKRFLFPSRRPRP